MKVYIKKHQDILILLALGAIFYFIFFHNIGIYELMDTDETRYVSMAKDMFQSKNFSTLYLNGEYFFEKPPLYFWIECLSFSIFKIVNEFSARFPIALMSFASAFLVYFTGKKIVSKTFGIVSSLIFATSVEVVILGKYAILDTVLSSLIWFSLGSLFLTFFCNEKNKKFFWWSFYIFSALAVLAKGIPGAVIPFGCALFTCLVTKKLKDLFKLQNFLPGIILFFVIILPWHLLMFKLHDPLFFNEYIMKHHIARFLNSENLGRKQPWFYFVLVFLWGFAPWIFSFLTCTFAKIKKFPEIFKNIKSFNFEKLSNDKKFLVLNLVCFVFIFLFFSCSSTKLMTYILPLYMISANLCAFFWVNFIKKNENEKPINLANILVGSTFFASSVIALFAKLFLPSQLYKDILPLKWFVISSVFIFSLFILVFTFLNKKKLTFVSIVVFISVLSAFGTNQFFEFDYKFGQNDLMSFAAIAKKTGKKIVSFNCSRKYSLLYYGKKHVMFLNDHDFSEINKLKQDNNLIIIVPLKHKPKLDAKVKDYNILKIGRKYMLIE